MKRQTVFFFASAAAVFAASAAALPINAVFPQPDTPCTPRAETRELRAESRSSGDPLG